MLLQLRIVNSTIRVRVPLFFSVAIGLPLAAVVLVWVGVHGAFPYIRSHINDPEIFPNVALSQNSKVEEYNKLQFYQLIFLSLITILEMLRFL